MDTEQIEEVTDLENSESKLDFLEEFENLQDADKKLSFGIQSMRRALSQEGTPSFKEFWEIRKLSLPLFKESMNPIQRKHLWADYIELSNEARRLKEILDEQTDFAVEQIDLAIGGLERDVKNGKALLDATPKLDFPDYMSALKGSKTTYPEIQKELSFFNALALKINGLRKELIKIEMRISQKNKFFKRLAALGDIVFPKRKEGIEHLSESFLKDVGSFVQRHFQNDQVPKVPYYVLREEIKTLQSMAKILTLHTSAFTQVRESLSKCWDRIKELDKIRKQQQSERQEVAQKANAEADEKIKVFQAKLESQDMTLASFKLELNAILSWVKSLELNREEERPILQNIRKISLAFEGKEKRKKEEKQKQEREKSEKQLLSVKEEIQKVLNEVTDLALLKKKHDELTEKAGALQLKKLDQQMIDRSLMSIRDRLLEQELRVCLEKPQDPDMQKQLKEILQVKKQRRQEIKDQLEVYRRALGGSNIDFEQGMVYRELQDSEKQALEKLSENIDEIEEKIFDFEQN